MDAKKNGLLQTNNSQVGIGGKDSKDNKNIYHMNLIQNSQDGEKNQDDVGYSPEHAIEKKEKSLGRLSQKFIQLFLVGNEVLSLNDAASKLLDGEFNSVDEEEGELTVADLGSSIGSTETTVESCGKITAVSKKSPSSCDNNSSTASSTITSSSSTPPSGSKRIMTTSQSSVNKID